MNRRTLFKLMAGIPFLRPSKPSLIKGKRGIRINADTVAYEISPNFILYVSDIRE